MIRDSEETLEELLGTRPKHRVRRSTHMGHCCFGGCRLLLCGCCANMGWHEGFCDQNIGSQFAEAEHDDYIALGKRKHLRSPGPLDELLDALPAPTTYESIRPFWQIPYDGTTL